MMRMNISESSSAGPSTWRKKAGRGRRLGGNGGSDVLDEERLDAERARLVSERQSALAGVVDKHDDLVRCPFSFFLVIFLMVLLRARPCLT